MDRTEIKLRIVECLDNIGIFIDSSDESDISLENYIQDSIHFIMFVVEIEKQFNIEIPDEYLIFSNFDSINKICDLLEVLTSETTNT